MSAFRYDGVVRNAQGYGLQGTLVYVLTQPANTTVYPPTPLASLFTDSSGGTALANPVTTDGLGNFFFYAATGTYTLYFYDPENRIPATVFPDQQVVTQGGGSVTSVAMTVPAEFSISGSPIISAGTLAIGKSNVNANLVAAGPASGAAAVWVFRALVSADLPAGIGTVSSVTLAVTNTNALFTASVTGTNPITGSGTFTLNLNFANQAANTFFAGPASGGSGGITARKQVAADTSGLTAVAFSATPVFDASTFPMPTFTMTLTGNVTSSSVTNPTNAQRIAFILTQDATGSRTFAWPANFKGASNIGPDANAVSVQEFIYDGTNWRATGAGMVVSP